MLATAARVCSACAWVLAAVAGIEAVAGRLPAPMSAPALAIESAFLWGVSAPAIAGGWRSVGLGSVRGQLMPLATASALIFSAVCAVRPASPAWHGSFWVFATVFAAFVEEMVFRVWLPGRLQLFFSKHCAMQRSLMMAVVLSQLTFATAHVPRIGLENPSSLIELARLAAGGVALWSIIRHVGLWAAVSLHSLVNVTSNIGASELGVSPAWVQAALLVLGGACLWAHLFAPRLGRRLDYLT